MPGKVKSGAKRPNVIPFGKYKGRPVEALAQDREYSDWLTGQAWFRERYANYYTLIVNNFGEASETPEHNAAQAEFLDEAFCRNFLLYMRPDEYLIELMEQTITAELALCRKARDRAAAKLAAVKGQNPTLDENLRDFIRSRRQALSGFLEQGAILELGHDRLLVIPRSDMYVRYLTDNLHVMGELASELFGRRIHAQIGAVRVTEHAESVLRRRAPVDRTTAQSKLEDAMSQVGQCESQLKSVQAPEQATV
jgi:hypothetical protein